MTTKEGYDDIGTNLSWEQWRMFMLWWLLERADLHEVLGETTEMEVALNNRAIDGSRSSAQCTKWAGRLSIRVLGVPVFEGGG